MLDVLFCSSGFFSGGDYTFFSEAVSLTTELLAVEASSYTGLTYFAGSTAEDPPRPLIPAFLANGDL